MKKFTILLLIALIMAIGSPYLPAVTTSNEQTIDAFDFDSANTTGLYFYYKGGNLRIGNLVITVADGSTLLTASSRNYIEVSPIGAVSDNTTGFTVGSIPLYVVQTSTTDVLTPVDKRALYLSTNAFGNATAPMELTYNGTKALSIYTTCASTDGSTSYEPVMINNILTGAGQVGGRVRINMETDVLLGGWANALKVSFDAKTSGGSTGLLSGLCIEGYLPAGAGRGAYTLLELEATAPATGYDGGQYGSFIYLNSSGATDTEIEDHWVLMHIDAGQAAGAGHLLSADSNTLKIALGALQATTRYILLSDAENELSFAGLIDISNTTESTGTTVGSITTAGGVGIEKKLFVGGEATFLNNAAAATFGNVLTDADVVLAFDAVTAQGSITYMEDEDRFDFDNDVDVVGAFTANSVASDTTVSGTTITASTGFVLGDGDYIGITSNEIITFNASGSINFSGASVDVDGAFTASTVASDAGVSGTTGTFTEEIDITQVAATAGIRSLDINASTSITSGTNYAVDITHTNTAGGGALGAVWVCTTVGADAISGAMGVMSRVDMSTYNASLGGANALYGEILLPNATQNGGEYHVAVLTLAESGANFAPSMSVNIPTSFTKYETWGGAAEHIDDYGYLFYMNGFTAAADHLVSLTKQTARVNIGKTARYLVLSQMQDGLGLGVSGTPMVLTTDANHAIEVHTTSPDAAGFLAANRIYHTNTAETTGGHWALWVQNTVGAAGAGHGAMYVKLDCATFEAPTGGNSALNVEFVLPNTTHTGGSYHAFVIDVDAGGPSLVMHGNAAIPCAYMKFEAYGADVAEWDTKAALFTISGTSIDTDHIVQASAITDINSTHSIRINIGGTYYYIPCHTAQNFGG